MLSLDKPIKTVSVFVSDKEFKFISKYCYLSSANYAMGAASDLFHILNLISKGKASKDRDMANNFIKLLKEAGKKDIKELQFYQESKNRNPQIFLRNTK